MGQHVLGKEITFLQMRVATQDEGADAHVEVAVQLGQDLVGIPTMALAQPLRARPIPLQR